MKLGVIVLWLIVTAAGQTSNVQIVHVGRVKQIDTKKNLVILTEKLFPERGSGGRGVRVPGLGADFPPDFPRPRRRREIETKVWYSGDTAVTIAGKPIPFGDLKVGDIVKVTGKPKKDDLAATEIEKLIRR